jgi:SPP1 gp7 family putative phage head morphogenesis protein
MISELEHSDFYKADYWPEVLARINKNYQFGAFTGGLIRDRDVFPANAVLSPEEKRRLGLNPRMKIPREMADFMTPYGLQQDNLKTIISDMALKYSRIIENQEALAEYKKNGVKYVELRCINDSRTCEDCRQKSGKVYLIDDAPREHCTNKYCRCLYIPK